VQERRTAAAEKKNDELLQCGVVDGIAPEPLHVLDERAVVVEDVEEEGVDRWCGSVQALRDGRESEGMQTSAH
jgi:hypothetical protein